ncbi:MAG: hypothetical protein L6305_03400 [Actinomycetia bacterium]|nr:hypothetical protein [Actinomycetes bacterium]
MNKIINTKISFKKKGEIKLRNIVLNDIVKIFEILDEKGKRDRDIVLELLHNQLIEPEISLEEFKKQPEDNLIKISKVFIEKEDYIFKGFKDTDDFYKDFVFAIKTIKRQQLEYIGRIVESCKPAIEEASQAVSKILETLPLARISEQIARIGENVSRVLSSGVFETIGKQVITLNEVYQKWIDQHKDIFENIGKYWASVWQNYKIAEDEAIPVLKKYKWFITSSMPINIVFNLMQLEKKKGRQDKAVNNLFIDYFSMNNWQSLEEMVNSWESCLIMRKRLKILRDSVQTLKIVRNKNINSSHVILPTLIAQIDGVLSDYLRSKNIQWSCSYDDFINGGGRVIRVGRKSQFRSNNHGILTTPLNDLANIVFLDILFQSSRQPNIPFNFNRHKIMHGEIVNFGRKDYLVRAFMVLDFLANLR